MSIIKNEFISKYLFAGNAYFTLTSKKTNIHYTYNLHNKNNGRIYYVKLLDGHATEYVGFIKKVYGTYRYFKGQNGKYDISDKRIIALMWFINHMNDEDIDTKVTFQHIGKCCKCGRKLTDPKSIELGIGPECAKAVNYLDV